MLDILFVSQTSNYKWILGHWVKQLNIRMESKTKIWWVPASFSKSSSKGNDLVRSIPLPKARSYYFSYPSIFMSYYSKFPERFSNNSILLYTHESEELGTIEEQVIILSKARKVHFMCSLDMDRLQRAGLAGSKCRLILGAVDTDCHWDTLLIRKQNSILLSSRYGPRKGAEHLLELIRALPDWEFTILGTGWEIFFSENVTSEISNLKYQPWKQGLRKKLMSENQIFLSLSTLEGGPIPLIEALSCGMYVVSTDTGFARDLIVANQNGKVIANDKLSLVQNAITAICDAFPNPEFSAQSVEDLTWDSMAKAVLKDFSA
jgi:glycosyltransferase involved in cell wall biosynthesis